MSEKAHTPGPWVLNEVRTQCGRAFRIGSGEMVEAGKGCCIIYDDYPGDPNNQRAANARLIAAAPEMLEALRLHKAWSDSENSGPDYGGQTRDTHPDGERIWRVWWNNNLDLCDRAQKATDAALSKATGGAS